MLKPTGSQSDRQSVRLLLLAIVAIAPAVSYFAILWIAFLFDEHPARWVATGIVSSDWSSVLFVALVGGGPILGLVVCLIVRASDGPGRSLAGVVGGIALLMMVYMPIFAFSLARYTSFYD